MKLHTFRQAEKYLNRFITTGHKFIFEGEKGLKRVKEFYQLLGNPQDKLKIIHVAGTSGKGSTCYLISSLLSSQSLKVGLTLSPHLTDIRERFQINGKIISEKEFVFYLNKIIPYIKGPISYFEILVGLAFYIFTDKKVDYAVIETGLGGLYDATNVVNRPDKLSVITKIGLDHQAVLGKTINKIAFQKAMIINENSQAISIYQDPEAEKVIREVAEIKKANVAFVKRMKPDEIRSNQMQLDKISKTKPFASSSIRLHPILSELNLIGDYQRENAGLALEAVKYLSKRDGFTIDQDTINKTFAKAKFPGRFDVVKIKNKIIIFDGAHNPQKMKAFIDSLIKKYPKKKFNFLLAFKKGKDYEEMLKIIISHANVSKIFLTSFVTENQDMINESAEPEEIGGQLNRLNQSESVKSVGVGRDQPFRRGRVSRPFEIKIIPNLKKAWGEILKEKESIVVTGSLYLVGEIFRLIKSNQTIKI